MVGFDKVNKNYYVDIVLPCFKPEHYQLRLIAKLDQLKHHTVSSPLNPILDSMHYENLIVFSDIYAHQPEYHYDKNFNLYKLRTKLDMYPNLLKPGQYQLYAKLQLILEDGYTLPLTRLAGKDITIKTSKDELPEEAWFLSEKFNIDISAGA